MLRLLSLYTASSLSPMIRHSESSPSTKTRRLWRCPIRAYVYIHDFRFSKSLISFCVSRHLAQGPQCILACRFSLKSVQVAALSVYSSEKLSSSVHHVSPRLLHDIAGYIDFPFTVTEYTDRLELKSANNRTFGIAAIPWEDEAHDEGLGEKSLIVLTASTLMKVVVDRDNVASFKPASVVFNLLQVIITKYPCLRQNWKGELDSINYDAGHPLWLTFWGMHVPSQLSNGLYNLGCVESVAIQFPTRRRRRGSDVGCGAVESSNHGIGLVSIILSYRKIVNERNMHRFGGCETKSRSECSARSSQRTFKLPHQVHQRQWSFNQGSISCNISRMIIY